MNNYAFFGGCFIVVGFQLLILVIVHKATAVLDKKIAYIVDTEKKVDELLKLMAGKVKKDVAP